MIAVCAEVEIEDNETAYRDDLKLTSELLNFAKQCTDPIKFTRRYGNGFVSKVYKGGVFRGLIEIRNTSINQMSEIKSKFGLMKQFLSGVNEAEVENSIRNLFETTECNVHLSIIGGDLEFEGDGLDLITLLKKAMEFKKEVLKNPVKTYVDVAPYEEMPEFMGLEGKILKYDTDLIANAMKAIKLICEYGQLLNEIEEAKRDIGSRIYFQFKEPENDVEHNIENKVYREFRKLETDMENNKRELIKFIQDAKFDPKIEFPKHKDVGMIRLKLKELIEAGVPNYITVIHGSKWREFRNKLPSKLDINRRGSLKLDNYELKVKNPGIGMSKETVSTDKMPGATILLDIMVAEVYITEDGELDLWADSNDYDFRRRSQQRAKDSREQRKREYNAEKAASMQEKVNAYHSKEQETMEMFRQMAEQQRKSGGGLWGQSSL
ncbi:27794_t:CDS:10 [Racocetra persica]|uniref:27794_t:CDS:1 n=1 Tax=Racocetra persica TaxID=160502 RepID=A0ACA9L731_9GLOM|nr:27794_t:CDS:10 [Racocetra persica]